MSQAYDGTDRMLSCLNFPPLAYLHSTPLAPPCPVLQLFYNVNDGNGRSYGGFYSSESRA